MSLMPKIPKGWYKLRGADKLTYDDRFIDTQWRIPEFPVTGMRVDEKSSSHIYIRRKRKARK